MPLQPGIKWRLKYSNRKIWSKFVRNKTTGSEMIPGGMNASRMLLISLSLIFKILFTCPLSLQGRQNLYFFWNSLFFHMWQVSARDQDSGQTHPWVVLNSPFSPPMVLSENPDSASVNSVCLTSSLLSNSSLCIPQIREMLERSNKKSLLALSTAMKKRLRLRGEKEAQMYWHPPRQI